MKPFVVERLFSTFIQSHNFKVASFIHERRHYIKKFGDKFGEFLFQLSALKNIQLNLADKDLSSYYQARSFLYLNAAYMISVWNLDDPPDFYLTRL